jgi:hypothetical protein
MSRFAGPERTLLPVSTRPTRDRPVLGSVDALIAGATERVPMKTADSLSGAPFERVVIGGARYVVKHLCVDDDWILRATGDVRPRVLRLWETGLLDELPDCVDPVIVGASWEPATRRAALLLRDVGDCLVAEDAALDRVQHALFLEHMAALHARFWGFRDDVGLLAPAIRCQLLSPMTAAIETARGTTGVPALLADGWARLDAVAPRVAPLLRDLAATPYPLTEALARTPQTLIHGDWKAGNLGTLPDGRTVLLDWAFPAADSPLVDLAWYLAVNCDRLPEPKDAAIERYRAALHAAGVDTMTWWDVALPLALLGALVLLGWSKTEDVAELGWWLDRVPAAEALLA